MRNLKISVIIPAYNAQKYITRCIMSITKQDYENIEIIVIDDGSQDNTKNIVEELKELDERIFLYTRKNGGVSKARNLGMEKASGEYLLFCDADDYYQPNMFNKVVSMVEKMYLEVLHFGFNFDYKLFKKNYRYEIDTNTLIEPNFIKTHTFLCKVIQSADCLNVWHMIIKADLARNICFHTHLSYGEDSLFVFETLLFAKSVGFTNQIVYNYCLNRNGVISNVSQKNLQTKILNIIDMYTMMDSILKNRGICLPENIIKNRCFEMIKSDLEKLYISNAHYAEASKLLHLFIRKLVTIAPELKKELESWHHSKTKGEFYIKKATFQCKSIIKYAMFSY